MLDEMTTDFLLQPVGTVLGGRDERVEDDWYGVTATIRLDTSRFGPGAVQGLDEFSHRLGVSRCRLLAVDGLDLRVADLDALAGTPVLDVKPYMREFEPVDPVTQPRWSAELMEGYYRS